MVFTLDADLPERLRPLAWLVGDWLGVGLVDYPTIESAQFGQEISVRHDGRGFLEWHSHSWLLDQESGERVRPLGTELGFWRPSEDGSEVELLLTHPTGILEMYYGPIEPAKLILRTDSVMRSPTAKEYTAGTRMYGLVDGQLLYAMDMAAVGQELQNHLSATLHRV